MLNIKASDECLDTFNKMKLKHKIGYMIMSVQKKPNSKDEHIHIVEKCDSDEEGVYEKKEDEDYRKQFIDALKKSGTVRYGVIDYNNKLLFVHWSPEGAKGKDKMVYSSVKEAFVQSLVGINQKLQANDDGELDEDIIAEMCKSNV